MNLAWSSNAGACREEDFGVGSLQRLLPPSAKWLELISLLFYGVSKAEVRAAMLDVLSSGLVGPENGRSVVAALEASAGPDLYDRLIANGYAQAGLCVLSADRKMAGLDDVRLL